MGRKKKSESLTPGQQFGAIGFVTESGIHFPDKDIEWVVLDRARMSDWFEGAGRGAPWREAGDPYRILVSEMMLEQTTVTPGVPYFARYIERFPDVRDLAEA